MEVPPRGGKVSYRIKKKSGMKTRNKIKCYRLFNYTKRCFHLAWFLLFVWPISSFIVCFYIVYCLVGLEKYFSFPLAASSPSPEKNLLTPGSIKADKRRNMLTQCYKSNTTTWTYRQKKNTYFRDVFMSMLTLST